MHASVEQLVIVQQFYSSNYKMIIFMIIQLYENCLFDK